MQQQKNRMQGLTLALMLCLIFATTAVRAETKANKTEDKAGVSSPTAEAKTYDNWTYRCELAQQNDQKKDAAAGRGDKKQCAIVQNLVLKQGGQTVMRVVVGLAPEQNQPFALFTLPLGVILPPGVALKIDEADPLEFPYEICQPDGCKAVLKLDDATIDKLKKGGKAEVSFHGAGRREVKVPLSLKGFGTAFAALTSSTTRP